MSLHTTLTLVRHGESEVTVRQVFGGEDACTGLSGLGRRQAEALRDRLARTGEVQPDGLWASTLPRAIETAEVLAPVVGDPEVQTHPDLQELRPGPVADGTPFAEYAERFGLFDRWAEPFRPIAPGGESLAAFHHRVGEAMFGLIDAHPGQSLLIVCHGGVVDAAFRLLLGAAPNNDFLWALNCSITEFRRRVDADGRPAGPWHLLRFNDAAHLAGLPDQTPR